MNNLMKSETELVYDDDEIRVIWLPGPSDFTLITFADLTIVPNDHKFFGDLAARKMGLAAIGVVAKRPNWYPAGNLEAACQQILKRIDVYKTRISYGASMGGYAAIKYSKILGVTHSIALCPQWSIDPDECKPHRSGWDRYFNPKLRSMGICVVDAPGRVFVLSDAYDEQDSFHRKRIMDTCPFSISVNVPFVGHHVTGALAGTENLRLLLAACRTGDLTVMRQVSRARRRHIVWERQILHFAMRRLPRLASRLLLAPERRGLLAANWRSFPLILSHLMTTVGIEKTVTFYENFRSLLPGISEDRLVTAYLASLIGGQVSIQSAHGSLLAYDLSSDKVVHRSLPLARWEVPVDFELFGSSLRLFARVVSSRLEVAMASDASLHLQPLDHACDGDHAFTLVPAAGGRFAIGCRSLHLSAEPGGRIVCDRAKPGAWELFRFHPLGQPDRQREVFVELEGRQRYVDRPTRPVVPESRQPKSTGASVPDRSPRLGLAITTMNRKPMLLAAIGAWLRLASVPFDLVVCDDGSEDGTVEAVRELGITVLGGVNRGIAWNKNRGLWHLSVTCKCDVILLADDDVVPVLHGWEQEWIAAVARVGHVNFIPPSYYNSLVGPKHLRASSLGVSSSIGGMILGQSAEALSFVGYMDPRFGRYGHEHTDFTSRFVRAGFGGFSVREGDRDRRMYYVISGGVELVPSKSTGNAEDLARNGALLGQVLGDPIYRPAWRDDAEMRAFQTEVCAPYLTGLTPVITPGFSFSPSNYLAQNKDVLAAGEPALLHYLRCGHAEHRKVGLVPECPSGRMLNPMSRL